MKKYLAVALALAFVFSALPAAADETTTVVTNVDEITAPAPAPTIVAANDSPIIIAQAGSGSSGASASSSGGVSGAQIACGVVGAAVGFGIGHALFYAHHLWRTWTGVTTVAGGVAGWKFCPF
jgi:hypothetical protein